MADFPDTTAAGPQHPGRRRLLAVTTLLTLPVLPRRCDHFRLRLTGTGAWRLLSLARTETAAGPQH